MEWKLFADLAEVAGSRTVRVDVDGDATVGDALDALVGAHPALESRVFGDDGELYDHINVLRNGEAAALVRTLTWAAEQAESTDDPRRATEYLTAAREAAEAISALDR